MADRKARYERRQGARQRREAESRRALGQNRRRTLLYGAGVAGVLVVLGGLFFLIGSLQKVLPPTAFGPTHSESLPPQQINSQFIPLTIQEHVMERGSGHTPGSMLVQYNCREYQCEPGLVDQLTALVRSYPPQVYLAPFPGMDAKIAVAAPGALLTLDSYDEERIQAFIRRNLSK